MTGSDKFPVATGKSRAIHQNAHPDRGRIDVDEFKRRALFPFGKRFAHEKFFEAGKVNDVAGGRLLDLDLLETRVGKNRGDGGAFWRTVPVQTDDRVSHADAAAPDAPKGNPAEIIAVIKIRHEHLEERLG